MRPTKLNLEGFTSFRDRQELDFAALELFSITGQTGSGKTSLLDAITFALYGKVPREVNIKELVSQGQENLKVEFRFQVNGKDYRVMRTWRYRRRTPENQFFLEEWQEKDWQRLSPGKKDASAVLGMDFETFTRVILLPQGQFAEFLIGSARDRRKILRQLIPNFQIFETMREQAGQQAKQLEGALKEIEAQLATLEAPGDEQIEQAREQFDTLETQLDRLNQTLKQLQQSIDIEETLLANRQRLIALQQEQAAQMLKAPQIETLRQRLQQAQAASQLQGDWVAVKEARERCQQTTKAAETAAKRYAQLQTELSAQVAAVKAVEMQEEELKGHEAVLAAAEILAQHRLQCDREAATAKQAQTKRQKTLNTARGALEKAQADLETTQQDSDAADQAVDRYSPGGGSRLPLLARVVELLPQWQQVQVQVQGRQQEMDSAIADRSIAEQATQDLATQLDTAERQLQQARTNLRQAEAEHAVLALRQSLHVGDACPVCNSLYPEAHLLPDVAGQDLATLEKQIKASERQQKRLQKSYTDAQTQQAAAQERETHCREDLNAKQTQQNDLQQQIAVLLQVETWDTTALQREYTELQTREQHYLDALNRQQQAAAKRREQQQTVEFAQQTHDNARSEWEQAVADMEQRTQQQQQARQRLDDALVQLRQSLGQHSYPQLKQQIEQQRQTFDPESATVHQRFKTVERNCIAAEARQHQTQQTAEIAIAIAEEKGQTWERQLQTTGFSEAAFLEAQATAADRETWQDQIDRHRQDLTRLQTQIEEVESTIGGRTTSEETIAQYRQTLTTTEAQCCEAETERDQLLIWINDAQKKRQQAADLSTKQTTYAEQTDTYRTLARNLQSDEFQAYLLEQFEADLAEQANLLLHDLTQRYSLTIEKGKYLVRDSWNGDDPRSIKTLSGGETFLSSLAMGLALSEKISGGTEVGSLFLDEGFGTLDAEALDGVTAALMALQRQNRIVGIITHIQELAEQMPVQVKVLKSPEGSQIEIV